MSKTAIKLAEEAEKALKNRIQIYQGEEADPRILLTEDDTDPTTIKEELNEIFDKGITEGNQNIADFQVSMKTAGNTAGLMRDYKHATGGRIKRAAAILNRMSDLSENESLTAAIAGASEKEE